MASVALSTLFFNICCYSKTRFQFTELSSYYKAEEYCRKCHVCSSKPLACHEELYKSGIYRQHCKENLPACSFIFYWTVSSAYGFQGDHAKTKPVMVFTALDLCCQIDFQKPHAIFPCQPAQGYNVTLPVVCVLLKWFLLLNKVYRLKLTFGRMFIFCFIGLACLFLCKFFLWLQSLEDHHPSRSLTNIWLYFLLGFSDNLIFDG